MSNPRFPFPAFGVWLGWWLPLPSGDNAVSVLFLGKRVPPALLLRLCVVGIVDHADWGWTFAALNPTDCNTSLSPPLA